MDRSKGATGHGGNPAQSCNHPIGGSAGAWRAVRFMSTFVACGPLLSADSARRAGADEPVAVIARRTSPDSGASGRSGFQPFLADRWRAGEATMTPEFWRRLGQLF